MDFLIDNYKGEIKDGDLICTYMIYYSKDLKKNKKIIINKSIISSTYDFELDELKSELL